MMQKHGGYDMETTAVSETDRLLVRLIYVSKMTDVCDTKALEEILKVSRQNNARHGVTGILCYDPAFFLQCLEGPRDIVNDLYADIARDRRHKFVNLLKYEDISERQFGEWSMAFVSISMLDKEMLEKYSNRGPFSPFTMTSEQAHDFLLEVAALKRRQWSD